MTQTALLAEFTILFIVLPLAVRAGGTRIPPIPVLWLATLYALWRLSAAGIHLTELWKLAAVPAQLPGILLLFSTFATGLVIWMRRYRRASLFSLPRRRTGLWLLIMLAYPLLSVIPQSIVYRAFLLQRFAPLLHSGGLLHPGGLPSLLSQALPWLIAGLVFGWMHVVFRNTLAIVLTLLGGGLFAWRYQTSGSLAAATLEHALYGCLMFTVGLGESFYHRRVDLSVVTPAEPAAIGTLKA